MAMNVAAVSPPGWEAWVAAHQAHPGMDSPFAVAWYHYDQSKTPADLETKNPGTGQCAGCYDAGRSFRAATNYMTYLSRYDHKIHSASTNAPAQCSEFAWSQQQMAEDPEAALYSVQAKAPPGWEDTVLKMKDHPGIDNPFALSWYLKNKGAEPHQAAQCESCKVGAAADSMQPGAIASMRIDVVQAMSQLVLAGDDGLAGAGGHPNERPFKAILHQTDVPSTHAPNGTMDANGVAHRVLIPSDVADRRLGSLVKMGIDATVSLDGHDATRKIGVIDGAARGRDPAPDSPVRMGAIQANDVVISGILWERDFPDDVKSIRRLAAQGQLGISYEICQIIVQDASAQIWRLIDFFYTGAASLRRADAAYEYARMAAGAAKEDEMEMDAAKIEAMLGTALESAFKKFGASMDARFAPLEAAAAETAAAAKKMKTDEEAAKKEAAKDEEAKATAKKDDEEAARKKDEAARVKDEEARSKRDAAKAKKDAGEPDEDDVKSASTCEAEAAALRVEASTLRAKAAGVDTALITAASALITDLSRAAVGRLATDGGGGAGRQLATDRTATDQNGGAEPRKTMSAGKLHELAVSKYPVLKGVASPITEQSVNEILANKGMTPDKRMELKLDLHQLGVF